MFSPPPPNFKTVPTPMGIIMFNCSAQQVYPVMDNLQNISLESIIIIIGNFAFDKMVFIYNQSRINIASSWEGGHILVSQC